MTPEWLDFWERAGVLFVLAFVLAAIRIIEKRRRRQRAGR